MRRFIVLDIETLHAVNWDSIRAKGGLFKRHTDPAWARVWPAQVCAVLYEGDDEKDRISTTIDWADAAPPLDNPYCPRLTRDEIATGMSPGSFFAIMQSLSRGVDAFVGYNVGFDMGALRHHAAAFGRPLPDAEDVCLMRPAAQRMGQSRWPKLIVAYETICGVKADPEQAHDADYDVMMTHSLLRALSEPFEFVDGH